ncbi:hypothetical protein INT08_04480 [Prosthecochloris sp. N3]|uniref:Organic solvent tolerance-like N-terminal domain-containing protein n=1 Tax=Prosthecochloris ethylica TaxID=2743976 RepID=A0ABR9XQX5_9CHLB|nr:OstA-like protein [Prosthecochloris ethylica]MBF0586347.1 hypothetical protein [Prosthecochloris ethylica]MBF0636435.1 hypothetical protein [Prosthecochloris ethylica]MEC9486996.1 OstA-like protein [Prosthecochloris sp.]NUK47609.1 hypothetical protein [Prosthecochloris ethylica]
MNRQLTTSITLILFLLASLLPGATDNSAYAQKKKIILRQANTLEGGTMRSPLTGNTEPVRSVAGDVIFQHGDLVLTCDRATEFRESQVIELKGNIRISDPSSELYGNHGLYYPQTGNGELNGDVKGRLLENDLVIKGQNMFMNERDDTIRLAGNALAWHGKNQLSGESMLVRLANRNGDRSIERITVTGQAFLAMPDTLEQHSELYHQLKGEQIVITLDEASQLRSIESEQQAELLYYTYEETTPSGVNRTSGKRITLEFDNGKISSITAFGNATGKQHPSSQRTNPAINLPGFLIRAGEKPSF